MAYAGVGLVYAAELISDCDRWSETERAAFKQWLTGVFVPACLQRASSERAGNNRTNRALLGLAAAYHFLDDRDSLRTLIGWLKLEVDRQIAADGHMPAETARGYQGLWYTYFGLAPLTAAFQIAWNAEGVDLFRYATDRDGIPWPFSFQTGRNIKMRPAELCVFISWPFRNVGARLTPP